MIKKIINYVLNLILLFSLTTVMAIFVLRSFLSSENIENMLFADNKELLLRSGEIENLGTYVSEDTLKETYSNLVSDYIKYNIGAISTQPSINELRSVLNEFCDNYDKVNENKIDRSFIDKNLSLLEETLKQDMSLEDRKMSKLLCLLYKDSTLYGTIILSICIIILLIVINKDIIKIISDLAFVFLVNTLGIYALGVATEYILKDRIEANEVLGTIIKYLKDILGQVSIANLIIGIILLLVFIVLKIVKKNKEKISL